MIDKVLKFKKSILFSILGLALLSLIAMPFVKINYDLTDYLPENVPSTLAMDVVEKSFDEELPNVNVFIPDVTIPQALAYKERLLAIPGVTDVLWLDDVMDTNQPLSSIDSDIVDDWYKEGDAFFMLAGDTKESVSIVGEIDKITGESSIVSGPLFNQATIQDLSTGEVSQIMFYMVPLGSKFRKAV